MTTERCECGLPTVCRTPAGLKEYVVFMRLHPSRRGFGQSRRSIAADAHLKKGRRS